MQTEQFDIVPDAVPEPTRRRITTVEDIVITYGAQYEGSVRKNTDRITGLTTIIITSGGIRNDEQLP